MNKIVMVISIVAMIFFIVIIFWDNVENVAFRIYMWRHRYRRKKMIEEAEKERDELIFSTLNKLLTADELEVLAHTWEMWGYAKMTFAVLESDLGIKNPRKLKADALKKLSKNDILKILYEEG